ncbi:MAG: hypothetical protein HYZ27_05385, partial [Deltaproteobacteria bacterium]|nr:hypothetical protein [Deltaproteobacteria bacterium]
QDLSFTAGTLTCSSVNCRYNTSGCSTCTNGIVEPGEVCDGGVGTATCVSEGFASGTLGCATGCASYDTSGCSTTPVCGDGLVAAAYGEPCEPGALNGESCQTLSFDEGVLACAPDCSSFDTSGCARCGDGVRNGSEFCDGADVNGETCIGLGWSGGSLACDGACAAYDLTTCTGEQCDNYIEDECVTGSEPECDGWLDCFAAACMNVHPYCTDGTAPTGSACQSHRDCASNGGDPYCWREAEGAPGGYCTELCDELAEDCPGDSTCAFSTCFDRCSIDPDCRPGYSCQSGVDPTYSVCLPA